MNCWIRGARCDAANSAEVRVSTCFMKPAVPGLPNGVSKGEGLQLDNTIPGIACHCRSQWIDNIWDRFNR